MVDELNNCLDVSSAVGGGVFHFDVETVGDCYQEEDLYYTYGHR